MNSNTSYFTTSAELKKGLANCREVGFFSEEELEHSPKSQLLDTGI